MNHLHNLCIAIPLLLCTSFSFAQHESYKKLLLLSYSEIDSLADIEYNKEDYEKAIPYMQAGREKARTTFGTQDSTYAFYTSDLGFYYQMTGQYEAAIPLFKEAILIREKVLGKYHPQLTESIGNLAVLYKSMGNYEQALPLLTRSMKIYENTLGEQHPEFVASLSNLAGLYESMGNYEQALPLFTQSMKIYENTLGVQHSDFAASLSRLAGLHQRMGNYEQALPLFLQSMNIREKVFGMQHPSFATSLNHLAVLHQSMGNYEQALPLFTQCIQIEEKILGVQHPDFATSLNNLAALHQNMGNYEQALPFYIECRIIYEKTLGVQHPYFATSLNNLASLYRNMGNYEQALPLLIQSIEIKEKALGAQHPSFATSLNNLAWLYEKIGNNKQALLFYIQSMKIREKALGVQHPDFANTLINFAALHINMGNYEQALQLLLQAIEVSSTLKLSRNITQTWADSLLIAPYSSNVHRERMIESLGQLFALLQKDPSTIAAKNKTLIIADLALSLLTKLRNNISNEQDKLRLLEQSNDWLQKSLRLLDAQKQANKAFQLIDQNKSVLLLQATRSEQAYRLGELPNSLVFEDKKLLKKQSQLEAQLLEKRSDQEVDSLRNALNHLNKELDNLANKIKKEYPKYYKLKHQQIDAKTEEIQALLTENTALLEYVMADSMLHLFYVDKKEVRWVQKVISNTTLSKNTKDLHRVLSDYKLLTEKKYKSYQKYTELAHWFYKNLIEPTKIDAKLIQNLIIVSDGELGHLPFEAFLVEAAPQSLTDYKKLHYLVNDFNVSYNYSAMLWKENVETPTPQNKTQASLGRSGQILALAANYDLKLDSTLMNVRLPTDRWMRETLPTLPAARKEVEALQEKFNGFFAFDKDANEKLLKEKAPNYAIIHLAMHGLLDSKRPMLSSLACSENNDSTESNFWQAHEISKMQLNANLVVLSACETGYGKFEQGNGIASLARAFMYAGASALIVSLWQVNDYATAELMKNLYNNLADGMKKDEALRQAKLQYMATAKGIMAHPAFWSPFIMMGNTEVMAVSRKGNMWGWGIGIGVLVLIGIGGIILKKNQKTA